MAKVAYRRIEAVGPAFWALLCRRRMAEYGTTEEQLAEIAVKAHQLGKHNDNARFRQEFTVADVLGSNLVSDPLRLYEICPVSDGAAAAVAVEVQRHVRAPDGRQQAPDPLLRIRVGACVTLDHHGHALPGRHVRRGLHQRHHRGEALLRAVLRLGPDAQERGAEGRSEAAAAGSTIADAGLHLQRACPGFDRTRFEALANDGLSALELKARVHHLCAALEATLPDDFAVAASIGTVRAADPTAADVCRRRQGRGRRRRPGDRSGRSR